MTTPDSTAPHLLSELLAWAKAVKFSFTPVRGRRAVDVPDLTTEELVRIDRKNLSKKQRQKTPRVKPMGRPKIYSNYEIKRVVSEVRQAVSESLTLTYSDIEIGSAYKIVSERLYGNDLEAEKVRYIWRRYKNKIP